MGQAFKPSALEPLAMGSTIGILGGGQLGRMTAMAANRLGYKVAVLSPGENDPAVAFAHRHVRAQFDDIEGLAAFADIVDVVTYEQEQVPLAPVQWLSQRVPVLPGCRALEVSQDRIREKTFLASIGLTTAPWKSVCSKAELLPALSEIGRPAIFKVAYGGYDGKGQSLIEDGASDADILAIWDRLSAGAEMTAIVERKIAFDCELSVIVARDAAGNKAIYDPALNIHKDHILDTSMVPAPVSGETLRSAREMGAALADALDLVGIVCLELFMMPSGELYANEIAPRPHNSGHWTIDATYTDQFEQVVRAICGLPLGDPSRFADARMQNLIGAEVLEAYRLAEIPNARLHLYGKSEPRPGRKMGHVTFLGDGNRNDSAGGEMGAHYQHIATGLPSN